ncbi:hypothetical protein GW7_14762 [Heterocephalus glaber]|uniref:Uncharacterized protein n=1 Tax=Heterocephalus glaber TaxID=10181 RepID=G5C1H4_HETGA|nr:hypothetical protein GW7_14762 [Heterocephalus glaber]
MEAVCRLRNTAAGPSRSAGLQAPGQQCQSTTKTVSRCFVRFAHPADPPTVLGSPGLRPESPTCRDPSEAALGKRDVTHGPTQKIKT